MQSTGDIRVLFGVKCDIRVQCTTAMPLCSPPDRMILLSRERKALVVTI